LHINLLAEQEAGFVNLLEEEESLSSWLTALAVRVALLSQEEATDAHRHEGSR
jgi:hypothetical protein